MTGDIPEAAFRLLNSLPVRTHTRKEPRPAKDFPTQKLEHGGQNRLPVIIDGVRYSGHLEARRTFKISERTLGHWLHSGKAQHAD